MSAPFPSDSTGARASARAEIERIDQAIVALIAERMKAAARIAVAKRNAGQPVLDPEQEARVVRRAAVLAREADLPEEELRALFWRLVVLTRRSQDSAA
jgi:chorismate mutase